MMAAPKAMSHGLGGGAGATLGAFAGRSAAKAGKAAETASAATTDNTTFFIESAPLIRSVRGPDRSPFACHPTYRAVDFPGCDRPVSALTCITRKFRPMRPG